MDSFSTKHLRAWWDFTHADYESETAYADFVDFISEDADYWYAHGWPAAWHAYDAAREMAR